MSWDTPLATDSIWTKDISHREEKEKIAETIAEYARDGDVIGVGSGSTAYLTIMALGWSKKDVLCIPTSHESELACIQQGLKITSLRDKRPDWCFDGADEIDPFGHMIKGRGGAMFREKMVMDACTGNRFILVDESKKVKDLGEKTAIPVEIHPDAIYLVEQHLRIKGATDITLRMATQKDGPVITENRNLILDVKFDGVPAHFDETLKAIPGVIETGLFMGYDPVIVDSKINLTRV